jgi:fatty-acyl-CoA synthase
MTAPIAQDPATTLPVLIGRLADKFGTAPALLSDQQYLTFRGLADRCNRYARWALEQKLALGDVVCLFMRNCPEYLAIWLGITKVGGIVSLVNTHLVGDSLAHSINIVGAKHLIVDAKLVEPLAAVESRLASRIRMWVFGANNYGLPRIDNEISRYSDLEPESSEYQSPTLTDRALYIYTSGTTGLPKAANVSHFRLMQWSHWFAGMMDTRASDRMYDCLPMYHSVGGVVAIGSVLVNGGSVMLRDGFSASRFWDDIVDWNCTLFQYIGELCRYLINSPRHPRELEHQLRLCCGNGLSSGVWDEFKRRFQIRGILEFYAATEGSFSLYNCEGKAGAIGRVPSFLAHRFPMALIKLDLDTGAPERNDDGRCIRCSTDEIGEAVGRIADEGPDPTRFEGYSDQAASDQKILRNAFVKGDAWFRSGDLMRRDKQGYFYFVDRVGDTFRWKGENVSTTELAELISAYPGIAEATVYGVTIPGTEGRAGMVTAVIRDNFDLVAFRRYLVDRMPEYARPLFLRITNEVQITTTFKSQKLELLREGYDPSLTTDTIYFNDPVHQAFVKLEPVLHGDIRAGRMRF